jgi:Baseplate J-like protein
MRAPPIEPRGYAEIVAETSDLAERFSGWRPAPDGQPDAGAALIGVFGRFAELVIERLNRAPDKHYLAFLNLIGTSLLPPQPARVPLTFQLAANSPVDAAVPAGTQAAAPPLDGEADEVAFETERDLVVTRGQLQAVYASDTETDTYSDRTAQATGLANGPFAAFSGEAPTPHQLYLACDPLLTQPGLKDVTLTLWSPDSWQWANWPITWAYWDGAGWQAATSSARVEAGAEQAGAAGFAWRVTLAQLPPLTPHTVNGIEAGWLRAQLELPLPPGETGHVPESFAIGARNPQDLALPLEPFPADGSVLFYLSADDAFAAAGARVRLRVGLSRRGEATENLQLKWSYQTGDQNGDRRDWVLLGQSSPGAAQVGATDFALRDTTLAFTTDGEISFHVPVEPPWPRTLFRGRSGRWLRVDITSGGYTVPPEIGSLTVDYDWEVPRLGHIATTIRQGAPAEALPPAAGFFNASALDLSKDFYPLGEQPRFNDTFYVACPDALARPGAVVKLSVTLTNPAEATAAPVPPVRTADKPRLAWEVSDGHRWRAVAADYALTTSGEVSITLPDPIAPTSVNGDERYWLRARLVEGNYGVAATYRQISASSYELLAATVAPPVIKALSFTPVGAQQTEAPLTACLSYNDFAYADHTTAAATVQGPLFTPFTPTADTEPALYLGFDRPFDTRPVTLYLQVEPPRPEEVAAEQLAEIDPAALAQLTWEYASPTGWRPLGALDETQALSSRGLVQFIGPRDLVARPCFGQTLSWLRLRWQRGAFPLPPRLRRVLLNTTWAAQVATVENEILGSSNGNPGQAFTTAQTPVQPGQQVLVRERERPAPPEEQALVAEEGAGAVTVTLDAAGQPDEIWVRWHAVPDFYQSGARDRHYTVDALTGEIRFGDGSYGMIPPQGQNNLRVTYRTGGGEQGNRAAGTIVELKSGVPYLDGVTNHEPAQGGAPREPIERLQARGPRVLRHRDRAVTAQDLEDLAAAASAEVARVAAIVPTFSPYNLWLDPQTPTPTPEHAAADAGRMGVIVVPNAAAARPTPSLGLLRRVQAHLQERCPPTADLWVAGPEWIAVTVEATVVPTSFEEADAVGGRVSTALERFLHPLTGGPDGQGWAFGRKPHGSDLSALVEAVDGVDHVRALTVSLQPETGEADRRLQRMLERPLTETSDQPERERDLQRWLDRALVYSGRHEISVALE